jgi:hypothetical protein
MMAAFDRKRQMQQEPEVIERFETNRGGPNRQLLRTVLPRRPRAGLKEPNLVDATGRTAIRPATASWPNAPALS